MEQLDRALANEKRMDLFPIRQVAVLATRTLDHAPVIITFQKNCPPWQRKGVVFKYKIAGRNCQNQREVLWKVWRTKRDNKRNGTQFWGR